MNTDRIEKLLKEKKISKRELERMAGIGSGSISHWKNNNPTQKNLKKVADALNVTIAYLTYESDFQNEYEALLHKWNKTMNPNLPSDVKLYENGMTVPVIRELDDMTDPLWFEPITSEQSSQGTHFGFIMNDDSMSPVIMMNDVLIVREDLEPEKGDICVVKSLLDGKLICRKLVTNEEELKIYQAINPNYDLLFCNLGKSTCAGIVVEIRRKLK